MNGGGLRGVNGRFRRRRRIARSPPSRRSTIVRSLSISSRELHRKVEMSVDLETRQRFFMRGGRAWIVPSEAGLFRVVLRTRHAWVHESGRGLPTTARATRCDHVDGDPPDRCKRQVSGRSRASRTSRGSDACTAVDVCPASFRVWAWRSSLAAAWLPGCLPSSRVWAPPVSVRMRGWCWPWCGRVCLSCSASVLRSGGAGVHVSPSRSDSRPSPSQRARSPCPGVGSGFPGLFSATPRRAVPALPSSRSWAVCLRSAPCSSRSISRSPPGSARSACEPVARRGHGLRPGSRWPVAGYGSRKPCAVSSRPGRRRFDFSWSSRIYRRENVGTRRRNDSSSNVWRAPRSARLATRAARPTAVVWPENVLTVAFDRSFELRTMLFEHVDRWGTPLLTGVVRSASGDVSRRQRYRSSVVWIAPGRGVVASQDKVRAVPILEGELDGLSGRLATLVLGDAAIGPRVSEGIEAGALRADFSLAVTLCYEALFPDLVSARRDGESVALLQLADDSWIDEERVSRALISMQPLSRDRGADPSRSGRSWRVFASRRSIRAQRGRASEGHVRARLVRALRLSAAVVDRARRVARLSGDRGVERLVCHRLEVARATVPRCRSASGA